MKIKNSCNYSFRDLSIASKTPYSYFNFKAPRNKVNLQIKILCEMAGWYHMDIKTPDGVVYTTFSPEKE